MGCQGRADTPHCNDQQPLTLAKLISIVSLNLYYSKSCEKKVYRSHVKKTFIGGQKKFETKAL